MGRTQLTVVERNGFLTVGITWPNGAKHYVGRYAARREAEKWIAEHRSMTAERIEETDIPTVARKWRPRKLGDKKFGKSAGAEVGFAKG
jgi:hypothetical protein